MPVCPPQTLHQNMQALFSTLAEAEAQQPYLQDAAVQRGTRCLAEYHLGAYGRAWNRYVPGGGDGLRVDSVREAGGQPLLPVSLLGTLASFLLLPLPRPVTMVTSLPEEGENEGNSAP